MKGRTYARTIPKCRRAYRVIAEHPGITVSELARRLSISYAAVLGRLISMEYAGFLLYEDTRGRLYAYRDTVTASQGDFQQGTVSLFENMAEIRPERLSEGR